MVQAALAAAVAEHSAACGVHPLGLATRRTPGLVLVGARETAWRSPAFRGVTAALHGLPGAVGPDNLESRHLQHFLARVCVSHLLTERGLAADAVAPASVYVRYTTLGAPRLVLAPGIAQMLDGARVSFSHDGGVSFAAVESGRSGGGLGLDAVHLPRLRRAPSMARLPRLYAKLGGIDSGAEADLVLAVARLLAIKESASKALGTGLRLGLGIGRPGSLELDCLQVCEPGTVLVQGRGQDMLRFAVNVAEPFLFAISSMETEANETDAPLPAVDKVRRTTGGGRES